MDFFDQSSFNAKFWEHGAKNKAKYGEFSTGQSIVDAAVAYFEWCDENPMQEQNWVGKDGEERVKTKPRVFTMAGFSSFVGRPPSYFENIRKRAYDKEMTAKKQETRDRAAEIVDAIDWVKGCITNQKYNGAATGFFNSGLVSRDLYGNETNVTVKGDKEYPLEVNHSGEVALNVTAMTDEELAKLVNGQ